MKPVFHAVSTSRSCLTIANVLLSLLLAACSGGESNTASEPTTTPPAGAGWTGVTNPAEEIAARNSLMAQMEQLMLPIDLLETQPASDAKLLQANAAAIAAMLQAVPHLFPPTTNRYDPKAETPATIALPAIWQDFNSFYSLATAAAKAADAMTSAEGPEALRRSGAALRGACTACHSLYLRKYEGPKVNAADANFDFDKALGN